MSEQVEGESSVVACAVNEAEAQAAIEETLAAVLRRAEQVFSRAFARPGVRLDLRGTRAGTASPSRRELRFNLQLYRENPEAYHREVVPHELAHLIAYDLHGLRIRPHGPEWKMVMGALGAPARATHRLDVSRAQVRREARPYQYACGCDVHAFTRRRHRNAERGARYRCRRCRQWLEYRGVA